ncbi:hypothetical protein [Pseudomonas aeruginosa]|uniref:hypothetical protein n=1 Tax=Pseudomonas aeruginosa TaxID=287 RepID=UPI002A6A8E77|nr:hypothetical protein [Pseudomonas aeruginosa]MDY1310852.1 hypothetical protein [Pseudomonas aeruginosa]MDY1425745.1 hypothetical protein [Pseudomonas aeruginosa]MDY1456755.1 hypothetical protein [Pseudomonas aeruginosa]MDY1480608.1 hypothetical protein [Pseudomonas aeruginosa]
MTESKICTCPSGDGSLRHPCPAHPASVELAGVGAKLTFINGRPAMCGCQVEYSSGGGEYSDVIDVTLCAKHSGSAILDLVATNRIALTPEYEGQWHADFYLDREIPLAKAEGATPAEAVLALMSAERIDPEQESVGQAGGDERAAFELFVRKHCGMPEHIAVNWDAKFTNDAWEGWKARAALAQPSPTIDSRPAEWSSYDPTWVVDFIRDNSIFNADMIERMLEYATRPAGNVPQAEQAEAERPEVVATVKTKSFGRVCDVASPDVLYSHCSVGDELMTVSQHERIVKAWIERWKAYIELSAKIAAQGDAANARLHEVATACATAEQERDAALAKLAELEKQEPAATVAKVPGEDWNSLDFHLDLQGMLPGTKLYTTPVAQAQHSVPELLVRAEGFVSGFEDDDEQEGVSQLLADLRLAIGRAK